MSYRFVRSCELDRNRSNFMSDIFIRCTRWCCSPNDHWAQIPTIPTDTLDSRHESALDVGASVVPQIIFTYKNLHRPEHRQHDTSLIHIIDVFREDIGAL